MSGLDVAASDGAYGVALMMPTSHVVPSCTHGRARVIPALRSRLLEEPPVAPSCGAAKAQAAVTCCIKPIGSKTLHATELRNCEGTVLCCVRRLEAATGWGDIDAAAIRESRPVY